jgi:hypothetical protein
MKLKFDGKEWIQVDSNEEGNGIIYLDGYLKNKLDLGRKLIKKGWDLPILIDGLERSGKSTLGMTIGFYLSDGTLNQKNFVSGLNDCAIRIKEAQKGEVLILDEGSLVFNSKDAMVTAQKQLLKILDVVGQKNLILIIILPSFFDLNKQVAIRRSRFLIHVYPDRDFNRGQFAYWSEKRKKALYILGKQNFGSYLTPKPNFRGSFTDFKPEWYEEYIKIKNKSLEEALDFGVKQTIADEKTIQAKLILNFKKNNPNIPNSAIAKGFGISERVLYRRLKLSATSETASVTSSSNNNSAKQGKKNKEVDDD